MKIALLFGSFNPIHTAHLQIAQAAVNAGAAEQTWLVVSPQNPLKNPEQLEPFEHRVKMAQIATQNIPHVNVCQIENDMPRPSYTINTIIKLQTSFPNDEFFILCGSDVALQLDLWHRIDELKQLVEFVVYPRGADGAQHSAIFNGLNLIDVSSTQLRETLDYSKMPKGVCDYILSNKLYGEHSAESFYNIGRDFYANGDFGNAINAFKYALTIDPSFKPASEMLIMVNEILAFRHIDIYNP